MKTNLAFFVFVSSFLLSCGNSQDVHKNSHEEMVFVKGGYVLLGSNTPESDYDEHIIRKVFVEDFYISKFEVTQSEWDNVMKYNPSYFRGENFPVEGISWDDALLFIERLNEKTGRHYRLPTQEEWTYAAVGGSKYHDSIYSGGDNLGNVAWTRYNSNNSTHPVGLLKPNSLGLYDMTGNVHEWCDGLYDSFFYSQDSLMNKKNAFEDIRVFKGGSWASDAKHCRISNINYNLRATRNPTLGFRLAEDAK